MSLLFASAFFLLVLPASFFGWGLIFRRLSGMPQGKTATTITLGIATVLFVGGWLNWLGLAYAPAVIAVWVSGLALAFFLRSDSMHASLREEAQSFGAGGLILSALFLAFLIFTQLPPWEYNPVDDLQKYFTWPVRMLATGTMVFSSTSAIGAESLGGQAFLHGIPLSLLPINTLAGVDSLFGLALCLLLALSFTRHPIAQLIGVLAIVIIHPQMVNISTLYIGTALIMASIGLSRDDSENHPVAHALLYAALLACKPTFALFVVLHASAVALAKPNVPSATQSLIRTAIGTVLFLSPWILLHREHWLAGIGHQSPEVVGSYQDPAAQLFSLTPLFYGGTMFAYSTLVFGTTLVAGIVAWLTRRHNDSALKGLITAAALLSAGHLIIYYIFGPLLTGQAMIVRYYTPMLVALVPVTVGFTLLRLANPKHLSAMAAIGFVSLLALFASSFGERTGQLLSRHHQLSYRSPPSTYTTRVLSGITQERLRNSQNLIPAGAPFLAWVETPFQLDFRRNPIHDIEVAGTTNPWATLPKVSYLLWDKEKMESQATHYHMVNSKDFRSLHDEGLHERQIAARWLDCYRAITQLTQKGRLVGQQGSLCVYELSETMPLPRRF